ncbi:MAG: prohibitin family protein [Anaerolineae bacterium]
MKKLSLGRTLGLAILVIVGLVIIFSSYTVIGPGQRGVVVMLGRVEQTSLPEGFHLVLPPVVRQVVPIDVRTKKYEAQVEAASSDLQIIQVMGVLNYHLNPESVGRLYQQVGVNFEDIIIVPAMQEAIKAATAQYRVDQILVQRAVIKGVIEETLTKRLAENDIVVDQFSLADVSFSDEFDAAIERKQVAEQAALQKQYELQSAQKDVEISLARAEGEKKAAIIAAEGRAEARKLEAEAEAEALRLIAIQLRGNSDLIRYTWAVKLAPGVSTVMLPSDQEIILNTGDLTAGQTPGQ